jgi:hypothetical protein
MLQKLYQLWYFDFPARRQFLIGTILVSFGYALFNALLLGRPEKRITWETMSLVILLTLGFSAVYCLRERASEAISSINLRDVLRRYALTFEFGAASVAVLLVFAVLARTPTSRVQAAGYDMRLVRAVYSTIASDHKAFGELTDIFETATTDRVALNPRLVNLAANKVKKAYQGDSDAWPAALAFLNYRSTQSRGNLPYAQGSCLQSKGMLVADLTLVCPSGQQLDGLFWKNVQFKDTTIIYHGGPTSLQNVQFVNCQFRMDYAPEAIELAKAITQSDTVTIKIDANGSPVPASN